MSYILEALKKSEQERQIGHVPDISQLQETAVPRPVPRWPRWLLAALLLNAVILVALAWRTWDARRATVIGQPPVTTAPAVTNTAPPAIVHTEPPAASARAVQAPEEAFQPQDPVTQMPEPVSPLPESEPMTTDMAPIAMDEPEPSVAEAAMEPQPELPPRWQDLPLEERTALPAPRIDVHVFAQEPERRFVLVNLHKYQVGDTLEGGAVLDAIHADGIVLSYGGRQYRLDRP